MLNVGLTAVLAQGLTREEFGTWSFVLVLTFSQGYFALLDFGMSVSGLRYIVRFRHSNDEKSASDVLAALRVYYFFVSLLGSVVVFAVGGLLLDLVGAGVGNSDRNLLLVVLAIRIFSDSRHLSNMVLLESASAFGRMRLVELSSLTLWTLLAFFVLRSGGGVRELAWAYLANGIVQLMLSAGAARSLEPQPRQGFRWSRPVARDLWEIGKWAALQRIGSVVYAQMDRTILAVFMGVAIVGDYEIPYKFQAMGVLMLSVFPSAIFPTVARFDPQSDRDQIARLFHRATRWTVGLSAPVILSGVFLSKTLIELWVGSTFSHLHNSVSLFLVWPLFASFHVIGASALNGIGRTRELFLLSTTSIVVNLVVSLVLVKTMGINGVILGTVLGYALIFIPYLKVEMRYFGLGYLAWTQEIAIPVLKSVLVQIPILFVIRTLSFQGLSPWIVLLGGMVSTLIGWFAFFLSTPEYRSGQGIRDSVSRKF